MGTFLLSLRRPFVADHFHDLPGFVEARHGHNWEAEVTCACGDGRETALEMALDAWVARMDYSLLNQQATLAGRNPTAELLAQDLYRAHSALPATAAGSIASAASGEKRTR